MNYLRLQVLLLFMIISDSVIAENNLLMYFSLNGESYHIGQRYNSLRIGDAYEEISQCDYGVKCIKVGDSFLILPQRSKFSLSGASEFKVISPTNPKKYTMRIEPFDFTFLNRKEPSYIVSIFDEHSDISEYVFSTKYGILMFNYKFTVLNPLNGVDYNNQVTLFLAGDNGIFSE